MDEKRWPRKLKAAKVEGRQGRGGHKGSVQRALAVREVGL